MPLLWNTINPADLYCLLVIYLVEVELDLRSDVASLFVRKISTINPIAITKFFDITCKVILLSLFASEHRNGGLLGPISTYFGPVETNNRGILYLHCLIW